MVAAFVVLTAVSCVCSNFYITDNVAYDWFDKQGSNLYKVINFTYIRILENFILLFGAYIHRNYPKELNIAQEIKLILVCNWALTAYFELLPQKDGQKAYCFLGLYNYFALGEIIRSCMFILALFVLTYSSTGSFPLPFTWVFNDLTKFIFEPTCLSAFIRYLEIKEPESSQKLTQTSRL